MDQSPSVIRRARFGAFEVDLATGELSRDGSKVKLPEQPLQILAMLLERSGDLVTREELQQKLWPNTFVDAEHSLNAAVKRLRAALGDNSENPRFIETLPQRGYRFSHAVEFISGDRSADKVSLPPENDRFLAELREIRGQLIKTNSPQALNSLWHRIGGLQNRYGHHPKFYEAQVLQDEIVAAICYLAGARMPSDIHAAIYRVRLQTAARVFDDRDALSMPSPVDGQWQTLGSIGTSDVLVVNHTVHEEQGKQVIRVTAARKATQREREAYERRREETDR